MVRPYSAAHSHTPQQENKLSVWYEYSSPSIALTQSSCQSVVCVCLKASLSPASSSSQGSTLTSNHLSNKLVVIHFWEWKGISFTQRPGGMWQPACWKAVQQWSTSIADRVSYTCKALKVGGELECWSLQQGLSGILEVSTRSELQTGSVPVLVL